MSSEVLVCPEVFRPYAEFNAFTCRNQFPEKNEEKTLSDFQIAGFLTSKNGSHHRGGLQP